MRSRLLLVLAIVAATAPPTAYAQTAGTVYVSPGGIRLRLMLDETNVGKEVSVGEMTFPPNLDSGEHRHGAIEIFYVVSGTLEHVVNGNTTTLRAGMTGFVKPPDLVRHRTGAEGAKTVVIWVPGDEAQRIVARWRREYP
jgi:quercetin dioxygenase-like cupin family protein